MDAAEEALSAAACPQSLVFVDVETTGASPAYNRIIEVGLVRVENGVEVEQWSALVDPEVPIPANIESFTGISNQMVRGAPSFAQIASEVFEKLRGATFVAHNARFDHAFLHREFLRVGLHWDTPVMCTVKLSRRLYPEYVRHNLDAVMERHGILCVARHRALGDALVLRDLWFELKSRWPPAVLGEAAAKSMLGAAQLPAHLPPELADELPDGPGVYRYFAADGALLYVGRSNSLRSRILAQLCEAPPGSRAAELASAVHRVDWSQTAGELGAMLREAQLIRLGKPRYNRRAQPGEGWAVLRPHPDRSGRVGILRMEDLEAREVAACFGVFRCEKDARKALMDLARAHQLCLKVLGFEDGAGSCLARQLGKCRGACAGGEPLPLHEVRVRMALSRLKIKSWPFAGRIALRERWRDVEEFHVLDHWAYLGSARCEEELAALATPQQPTQQQSTPPQSTLQQSTPQQSTRGSPASGAAVFDPDVYKILVRHFSKHSNLDCREFPEALNRSRRAP
jgi:DNA polymerase-3 subunit epsilon